MIDGSVLLGTGRERRHGGGACAHACTDRLECVQLEAPTDKSAREQSWPPEGWQKPRGRVKEPRGLKPLGRICPGDHESWLLLAVPGAAVQPRCAALWDPAIPGGHSEWPGPCPLPQGPAFICPAHNPPPSLRTPVLWVPPPPAWPCPPTCSPRQTLSFPHPWIPSSPSQQHLYPTSPSHLQVLYTGIVIYAPALILNQGLTLGDQGRVPGRGQRLPGCTRGEGRGRPRRHLGEETPPGERRAQDMRPSLHPTQRLMWGISLHSDRAGHLGVTPVHWSHLHLLHHCGELSPRPT